MSFLMKALDYLLITGDCIVRLFILLCCTESIGDNIEQYVSHQHYQTALAFALLPISIFLFAKYLKKFF